MNNKKLSIINVVLALVAVFLVYLVYKSISEPVVFENTLKERELGDVKDANVKCVKQSLIDIRDVQNLFKQSHNRYTGSFDTLIAFAKSDSLPIIHSVHDESDTTWTKTIDSIAGYTKISDSLFGNRKHFNIDDLRIVPFSQNVEFELQAGFITRGGLKVAVFEAKTPYSVYLWDLDPQRVNNLRAEKEDLDKYAGLKVGSMDEPSTSGNWESL